MARSGSTNFSSNAQSIIKDALILLGSAHEDEAVHQSTENFCLRMLNRMVKSWQKHGIHLWAYDEAVIIFDNDTVKYTFADSTDSGADSGICIANGLATSTLSAAEAAAQTVISVTDTTGMAASDNVIIQLDSGERHVTTIVSVDSSTQVTITSGLATAAASGNAIYAYPATNAVYPKEIHNVRLRDAQGNERPVTQYSRNDYMMIADKDMEATPTAYYFDEQYDNATLRVWPEPDNLKETLRFTYSRALEDIDVITDNMDFPPEWEECIVYNLAARVAPSMGKEAKMQMLGPIADSLLDECLAWDNEDGEVSFVPDMGFE